MNQKEINEIGKKYLGLLSEASSFESFLKNFKNKGWNKVRNRDAWINKKEGIIVKFSYTLGLKPRGKFIIPSFVRHNYPKKSEFNTSAFIVQPIAETTKGLKVKAYKELEKYEYKGRYNVGNDLHEGNVGYYKGRAVVFDW